MAYLLMFVTLLHLITLAMLFIATMEKVVHTFRTWCLIFDDLFALTVLFFECNISSCVYHLSLKSWWVWDGRENSDLWYNCRFDNFTGTWLCASSKETGKQQFHFWHVSPPKCKTWDLNVFFSQTGWRQCRSSWFSQWSSLRSPSWCSWVNCSPCLRADSSTSPGCVKSLQVTVGWNNVGRRHGEDI